MVGSERFELSTPCTPCKCATRLRHDPIPVLGRQIGPRCQGIFSEFTSFGLDSSACKPASSSSDISEAAFLNSRIDRPRLRANLGKRSAPKRISTTSKIMMISEGLKFPIKAKGAANIRYADYTTSQVCVNLVFLENFS